MKKGLKIIAIVIFAVGILFFGMLTFNYCYNESVIKKCDEGNCSGDVDVLTHTSIFDSYVAYYNNGNIHYQKGEYEEAIEDYKEALSLDVSHEEGAECDIRVNLALAIIHTLPDDYYKKENIHESVETLKEAREYLLEEDCAMDNKKGHDEDAQKLKEEIDKIIKILESQCGCDDGDTDVPVESEGANNSGNEENDIMEQLINNQNNAEEEREETMEFYEDFNSDYGNWGGIVW